MLTVGLHETRLMLYLVVFLSRTLSLSHRPQSQSGPKSSKRTSLGKRPNNNVDLNLEDDVQFYLPYQIHGPFPLLLT